MVLSDAIESGLKLTVYDKNHFRFDVLLDRAWSSSLPAVTAALFD